MAGYKPITSTFLFKNLGGNVLTSKINDVATKGKRYSEQDLLEQFVYIKNYERSLLKQRVITEFKEGRIELLYADNMQVSKLMPFVLVPSQIGHKVIIFLNPFCNMRSDGLLNIRGNLLYTLMESAYLAKNFADNYNVKASAEQKEQLKALTTKHSAFAQEVLTAINAMSLEEFEQFITLYSTDIDALVASIEEYENKTEPTQEETEEYEQNVALRDAYNSNTLIIELHSEEFQSLEKLYQDLYNKCK